MLGSSCTSPKVGAALPGRAGLRRDNTGSNLESACTSMANPRLKKSRAGMRAPGQQKLLASIRGPECARSMVNRAASNLAKLRGEGGRPNSTMSGTGSEAPKRASGMAESGAPMRAQL